MQCSDTEGSTFCYCTEGILNNIPMSHFVILIKKKKHNETITLLIHKTIK